jgi:hypothetical protein
MTVIERWECPVEAHGSWPAWPKGEPTPRCRRYPNGVTCGREMVKVEYVRVEQLRGAVEAGTALYAALRDGRSLGDEAVHNAMARWEALGPPPTGGQ